MTPDWDTLKLVRWTAQGKTRGRQPPEHLRERIATYFDPLPFWYPPLEDAATDLDAFPLNAITQRPMAHYHSWDAQNAHGSSLTLHSPVCRFSPAAWNAMPNWCAMCAKSSAQRRS